MKKHPDIFSEEEKELLTNFFIKKSESSKKNFDQYVLNMIKEYGQEDSTKQNLLWERDFSNIMWDKNNNLVSYFFSHPKFKFTGASIKNLHKLRPDWSYINKDGDTALHLMAKKGSFSPSMLEELVENFKVDINHKNNEGKFFSWYLFDPTLIKPKETHALSFAIHDLSLIFFLSNFLIHNLNHLQNISDSERSLLLDNIKQLKSNYIEHYEKNVSKDYQNQEAKIDEIFNPLIVTVTQHHFDNILDIRDEKKTKAVKI